MKLEDYENRHIDQLRKRAGECTLFLKRDGAFPVKEPGTLALYGNGARNTIKGGTGSGDVDSRFFVNFEDGLSDAGFKVLTKEWLDGYDEIVKAGHKSYIREAKAAARKAGYLPVVYTDADYAASNECYKKIGYRLNGRLCTLGYRKEKEDE